MSKHTPGPWEVAGPDDDPYGDIRVGRRDRGVCKLWQDDAPEHGYNAEQWANARLIAAAPDLLEAIRGTLDALRSRKGTHAEGKLGVTDLLRLKAAVAKAEGGAR